MSCANVFYVSNKFHDRRVEYAMNAFGARVMHDSIRHMRFQFLSDFTRYCFRSVP